MSLIPQDLDDLRRAADRIDAEVSTWYEGIGIYNERKKEWHIPESTEESLKVRVMQLESSSRALRRIRAKLARHHPPDPVTPAPEQT